MNSHPVKQANDAVDTRSFRNFSFLGFMDDHNFMASRRFEYSPFVYGPHSVQLGPRMFRIAGHSAITRLRVLMATPKLRLALFPRSVSRQDDSEVFGLHALQICPFALLKYCLPVVPGPEEVGADLKEA